jgi:hypothetical protein
MTIPGSAGDVSQERFNPAHHIAETLAGGKSGFDEVVLRLVQRLNRAAGPTAAITFT